jgi:hypothetical protein
MSTDLAALEARVTELSDRLAIADAYVRYAVALDDCRRDLLAEVFDEETLLQSANPAIPQRTGLEANWNRLVVRHEAETFRERHITTAPVILKLTADTCEAVAESVMLKRVAGGEWRYDMIGLYRDTLVKKGGRWVFRSRYFTPDIVR